MLKEKKLKPEILAAYIIVGAAAFVYGILYALHFETLRALYPRMPLSELINATFEDVRKYPFSIQVTANSVRMIAILALLILTAVMIIHFEHKLRAHDNPETVNGDAHWMTSKEKKEYDKRFTAPFKKVTYDGYINMILSKTMRLALDNRNTRRNANMLIIGGSGAGKSRFFAGPSILSRNSNFIVTDPAGEMLADYGKYLENNGYTVRVFNLIDTFRSSHYNPFHYIKDEKDVFILVNVIIKNTTPPNANTGDPFWEKSEQTLLEALILYLWHEYDEEDQTFANVMELLNFAEVDENNTEAQSTLDIMFADLERRDPENLAVRQYHIFKMGAGKTLKSILISCASRLHVFNLNDIRNLTNSDDLHLENFADTKQALFILLPTGDDTFQFLASLMYSQLFMTLFRYAETTAAFNSVIRIPNGDSVYVKQADRKEDAPAALKEAEDYLAKLKGKLKIKHNKERDLYEIRNCDGTVVGWRGSKEAAQAHIEELKNAKIAKHTSNGEGFERLPNHCRMIMDEFANIGSIPQFSEKLATIRKYEISCNIIIQSLSQLKKMYKDEWNDLTGNCDTKIFLGTDDAETNKWLVEMLGKRTTVVENLSFNSKRDGSTGYNHSSIELITVDQLAMMKDDECIVRIRGVRPVYDKKYEITLHPHYKEAMSTKGQFKIIGGAKRPAFKHSRDLTDEEIKERIAQSKHESTQGLQDRVEDVIHGPKPQVALTPEEIKAQKKEKNASFKAKAADFFNNEDSQTGRPIITQPVDLENPEPEALEILMDSMGIEDMESFGTVMENATSFVNLEELGDEELKYQTTA